MKLASKAETDYEPDLTPLIDCVFLLILFFLLTTEITVQIEDVELPFALEGKVAERDPNITQPLIVNVVLDPRQKEEREGVIRFNGEDHNLESLRAALQEETIHDVSEYGSNNAPELAPDGKTELSGMTVLIRADRAVKSEFVRQVFTACATLDRYKIYKVKISTQEPEG